MPRYDPSEKTKGEILSTAMRLFNEKGWSCVNIEDIVTEIGLTRGAFYHYFKSRNDLIYAVIVQSFIDGNPFELASREKGLSGLEKIRFALKFSLKLQLDVALKSNLLETTHDPVVFKSNVFSSVIVMASAIEKLLIEGNRDGSTSVQYPMHTAHAAIFIFNEWLNPAIFQMSELEFSDRLSFLQLFGEQLGMPVLDRELREMLTQLYECCKQQ